MYVKRDEVGMMSEAGGSAGPGLRARQSFVTRTALLTVARELFAR
jgi:hypothetical protein